MKHRKVYSLMLVLLAFGILLSACGSGSADTQISMQEIVDANRTAAILAQHGSVLITVAYGDGAPAETIYVDAEIAFTSYREAGYEQDYMITRDENAVEYFRENDVYGTNLYVGEGWETDLSWIENLVAHEETTLRETVTGTKTDGDKRIVNAELTEENLDAELYPDYQSLSLMYLLDAETKLIHSMQQTARCHDGSEETVLIEVHHGAARPEMAAELYARAFRTEEVRSVTVVVAAGTDAQASYTASVPKGGDRVALYLPQEDSVLYYDPECTQSVDLQTAIADYDSDAVYYMNAD